MMSQNRQEEKDRLRAENDYKVNLKTEILIEDLYDKVNAILAKQLEMERQLQAESKKYEEKPQWFSNIFALPIDKVIIYGKVES